MGRYYNGDIEGKFWFGVQSSGDADFFGCEGEATHLNYYYHEGHLDEVKERLKECKKYLGKHKKQLDTFFKTDGDKGYNDEMLLEYLLKNNPKYPIICGSKVRQLLEWYARYYLGNQIYKCIKDNGECNFEAEL